MATSSKKPSPEGKIMASASRNWCGACENNKPVKHYCPQCEVTLCNSCMTAHKKFFKDHDVCDISDMGKTILTKSYPKSGEAMSGLSKCNSHNDKILGWFCDECMCLICDTCKSTSHKHHAVQPTNNDLKVYQAACRKYIQTLLADVHDLEKLQETIGEIVKAHDDAIDKVNAWETDLLKYIREKARKLRDKITHAKKEYEKLVYGENVGLQKLLNDADKEVTKLDAIRKSSDCEVLSHALAECQKLMEQLKNIKLTHQQPQVPKVSDIIPGGRHVKTAEGQIDEVFTMNTTKYNTSVQLTSGVTARLNTNSLTAKALQDIKQPQGDWGYRVSSSDGCGNIILHGDRTTDIRVMNSVTNNVESQRTSDVKIWNMVTTDQDEQVVINEDGDKLHLLDGNFHTLHTSTCDSTHEIKAVGYLSKHRFMKYECTKSKPCKGRLSTMSVNGKTFTTESEITVDLEDNPFLMNIDQDQNNVFLCSSKYVYNVNLRHGSCTKHDILKSITEGVWSMYREADNILIGDHGGNVHLFDRSFHHIKVIMKINSPARDIIVRNGSLLVISRENKVHVYQ